MTSGNGESKALSDHTRELLTHLWRLFHSDERQVSEVRLRNIARQVGLDAHELDMRPADLIMAVNESWGARDRPGHERNPQRSEQMVNELISQCLVEFYFLRRATESTPSLRVTTQQASADQSPPLNP